MIEAATEECDVGSISVDEPKLLASLPGMDEWKNGAKVQMMLATFGGSYKKREALKEEYRVQQVITPGQGREETQTLFKGMDEKLTSGVLGSDANELVKRVTSQVWLFGCDPKMQLVAQSPNCLPQWRVLVQGEIRLWFIDTAKLVTCMKAIFNKDQFGLKEMTDFCENIDAASLKDLQGRGLTIFTAVQKAHEVVYVPTGWLLGEMSVRGVLIYGVRRALVVESLAAHVCYEELVGAYKTENKAMGKMEDMLSIIKPDDP